MLSRYLIKMKKSSRYYAIWLSAHSPLSGVPWLQVQRTGTQKGRKRFHYWCSQTLMFSGFKMIQYYQFLCMSSSMVPHTLHAMPWHLDIFICWDLCASSGFHLIFSHSLLHWSNFFIFLAYMISLSLSTVRRTSHPILYSSQLLSYQHLLTRQGLNNKNGLYKFEIRDSW